MRRLLTMVVTVSGMVISAPALAMAAVPTAGHHAHRAFPVFSLTVTPASARIPVGREIPMTVTVRNNTGQPQQGILTLQLQNAAASHRLAVMLARHCAFERGTTTSECRFSVKPGTATKIDYSLLGTAPGMVTAAFAAAPYLPARQGRVHRSARGSDVTGRAATTSVRLQVINRLHAIKGSHHSLQRHNERYHAGPTNGVQVQLNGPDSATTGQILRYTATVANPSTYAARSVHLSVTLPGGMRGLTLASKTGTCTITHHKASCEFSKIDAGRSASVTVKAAVTGPLARCWCATAPVIARVSVVKCYGPMPKVSTPEAKITTVEKPAEKPAMPAAPATHRHNATPPCIAAKQVPWALPDPRPPPARRAPQVRRAPPARWVLPDLKAPPGLRAQAPLALIAITVLRTTRTPPAPPLPTTPPARQVLRVLRGLRVLRSTRVPLGPRILRSTRVPLGPRVLRSTRVPLGPRVLRSTRVPLGPRVLRSTRVPLGPRVLRSTRVPLGPQVLRSTRVPQLARTTGRRRSSRPPVRRCCRRHSSRPGFWA